jgi:fatty acid desaturase
MDGLLSALVMLFLGYVYYLGQIAIHGCVHYTLFKTQWLNRAFGTVLCSLQLTHFDGWRAAHLMHHRFTQTARDPHRVDRNLLPYIATHYFRVANYVWQPWRFLAAIAPPVLTALAIVIWQFATGHSTRGLSWVLLYWLIPVFISHALVAHFNFITHAGLPPRRGRDTRSFTAGAWRYINMLTFDFYLHAEHHLNPQKRKGSRPHTLP